MILHLLTFSLLSRRTFLSSTVLLSNKDSLPSKPVFSPNIYFYKDVLAETCSALVEEIDAYSKVDSSAVINLHIQSHGGSAVSSFYVSDFMKHKNVNTYIDGMAASAASIISVSGKKRFMSKHSFMLIHQPSIELGYMKYRIIEDEKYNLEKMLETLLDIYEDCSLLDRTQLKKIIFNEKYLTAQECLRYGLVDQII